MENNLLAEIFVAQKKIEGCLNITPSVEPSLHYHNSVNNSQSQGSIKRPPDTTAAENVPSSSSIPSNLVSTLQPDSLAMSSSYLITVEDVVQRETSGGLMGKSKYVVYGLSVRRLIDGVEHKVFHRFRDIKALYYNIMMEFEDIEYNAAVKFPNFEASWSMSNQNNNPNSELVIRRRTGLQTFFYELFKHYPFLLNHPRVQEFLDLKSLHASSVSSFSVHLASNQQQSMISRLPNSTKGDTAASPKEGNVSLHDSLAGYSTRNDSGWEYDESQGRLINVATWKEATPTPRQMSYVDFSSFNQWYESKTRAS